MKELPNITIIGAGAVGLELAARITAAEEANVTLVGKPGSDRLNAVETNGITVDAHSKDPNGNVTVLAGKILTAANVARIAAPQDYVIVAVKGQDITDNFIDRHITPLIDVNPNIKVVMAQNGIPVWFNYGISDKEYVSFPSIDPNGTILRKIGPERIIGMVLQGVTSTVPRPGTVKNETDPPQIARLIIGTPDGRDSNEMMVLANILDRANMSTEIAPDIRNPLINKLMLNIGGCVTTLTGNTVGSTMHNTKSRNVTRLAIAEASNIISRRYPRLRHYLQNPDVYIAKMEKLSAYYPSIWHDLMEGKPTERAPILDAIVDMERWVEGGDAPVLTALSQAVQDVETLTTTLKTPQARRTFLEQLWHTESAGKLNDISNAASTPLFSLTTQVPNSTMPLEHHTNYGQSPSSKVSNASSYLRAGKNALSPEEREFYRLYLVQLEQRESNFSEDSGEKNSIKNRKNSSNAIPIPQQKSGRYSPPETIQLASSVDSNASSSSDNSLTETIAIDAQQWDRFFAGAESNDDGVYLNFVPGREHTQADKEEIRALRHTLQPSLLDYITTHNLSIPGKSIHHHRPIEIFIACTESCPRTQVEKFIKDWYNDTFPNRPELAISRAPAKMESRGR